MWLWDMWGVLWAVEAVAQLAGVLATPLDPAPTIPQGELRRTWPPTLPSYLTRSVACMHSFIYVLCHMDLVVFCLLSFELTLKYVTSSYVFSYFVVVNSRN